ncbi:unnamed protein product [Urochloa humidicola]
MDKPVTVVANVWHFPLLLQKKENSCGKSSVKTAVVRVKAPDILANHTTIGPIHLVIVMDVCCSVVWEAAPPANKPLRLDLLMKAMKFILKQLHEGDYLSIVFNDNLDIDKSRISEDAKIDVERTVNEILAKDDTAFKPNLDRAIEILNSDRAEDKEHLGFILVLSDGLEDSKFRCKDDGHVRVARSGIGNSKYEHPIHTFGLCKTHDPRALQSIAKEFNGTYSSITEDLSNKILEGLAVCLGGLKNVVAVDTVINIVAHKQTCEPE